jgi:hypothetical protein
MRGEAASFSASSEPRTLFNVESRDAAGTKQHRRGAGKVHDGGLDADLGRPAFEHEVDVAAEVGADMRRGGRRNRPKRLAEGAATPRPKSWSNSRATGCDGRRSPTVSCPPVTKSCAFCER